MNQDSIECKNCGTVHHFNYCPNCGQVHYDKKFTLRESTTWLFSEVFNLNKGFFYSTKEMILQPKFTLEKYLNRATKQYYHPFRYIFVWASISSILIVLAGVYDDPTQFNFGNQQFTEEELERTQKVFEYIKKYQSFLVMLGLPFLSLSTWLFYKGKGQNYTEHLIINCFAYGTSIAVSIPFLLLIAVPNGISIYTNLSLLIYMIIYAYAFSRFYSENFVITFLKFIVINILAAFLGFLISAMITIPGILIYKKLFS